MRSLKRAFVFGYLAIGVLSYVGVRVLAGGLGIVGLRGPAGAILEFSLTVLAWPFVALFALLVVSQGR